MSVVAATGQSELVIVECREGVDRSGVPFEGTGDLVSERIPLAVSMSQTLMIPLLLPEITWCSSLVRVTAETSVCCVWEELVWRVWRV